MDRFDKVLRIAGFGNITLGTDFDGARGEYRIIVDAEHDDTCRGVAREETPCQLKPGNCRKVNVDYADIRMPFAEHALATLRVGGFQYVDLGIVREQGTAPRSNDAMIINNQNAHWHWSRTTASLPLLHRIRRNTGADFGAIAAVDDHATRAMLLYASIR